MTATKQIWQYYWVRFTASVQRDSEQGDKCGRHYDGRVTDKANSLDLG